MFLNNSGRSIVKGLDLKNTNHIKAYPELD